MRLRTLVAGMAGVALTGFVLLLVLAPEMAVALVPIEAFHAALGRREPSGLALLLGAVVGSYAVWAVRRRRSVTSPNIGTADERFATAVERPPEAVGVTNHTTAGAEFDRQVAGAVDGDPTATEGVRETLRATAVQTYWRAADCEQSAARRAVATGAWTDDSLAAAFLAESDGPTFSLWARLRGWLDPEAERERRIRRSVDAIRASSDADGGEQL